MTANTLAGNRRQPFSRPQRLSRLLWAVIGGVALLVLSQMALLHPSGLRASSHFSPHLGSGPGGGDPPPTPTSSPTAADLAVTISVTPTQPLYGHFITYTIVVTNLGPDEAHDIKIKEGLPAEVKIVDWIATLGSYDPLTKVWAYSKLADGTTATLTITAQANACPSDGSPLLNTAARVESEPTDANPDNDTSAVWLTVRCADLAITEAIRPQGWLTTGSRLDYLITVTNRGPFTATGVTISSILPDLVRYRGYTLTPTHTYSNQLWTLQDPLAKGESAVLTVRAGVNCKVTGSESTVSTVAVSGVEPDLELGNNVAKGEVKIEPGGSCFAYLPTVLRRFPLPPCYIETFKNNQPISDWHIPPPPPGTIRQYINEEYQLFSQTKGGTHWSRSPIGVFTNYILEVEARWESSFGKEYGLIFDRSGANDETGKMYRFNINPIEKTYIVGKLINNQWVYDGLPNGSSLNINDALTATNKLTVIRIGNSVELYINERLEAHFDDTLNNSPAFLGINVIPVKDLANGDARFDNFKVCSNELNLSFRSQTFLSSSGGITIDP